MYCKACKKEKDKTNFYQGFDKCKKCLEEYLNGFSNEVACVKVKELLYNYNYIINQELLDDIFFSDKDTYRGISNASKLLEYLKMINSLPQYKDYRYRVVNEDESDIDFINKDIEGLKERIKLAINHNDFNAHNKWMNCLRDAIELRERLQGVKENIINIGTIMVKDEVDINKLTEELTKIVKKQINCR